MNPSFTSSISIVAAPSRVMWAFFNPVALAAWWQTSRSVTVPRVLGAYAVEWEPTEFSDEMLGRLGGTFHGTVMEYKARAGIFRRGSVLAAARRQPDRADGARGEMRAAAIEESAGHAREGDAACVRGWRSLEALLRSDRARLGARAAVPQAVPGKRPSSSPLLELLQVDRILVGALEPRVPAHEHHHRAAAERVPSRSSSCFNSVPVVSASFAIPVVSGVTPR